MDFATLIATAPPALGGRLVGYGTWRLVVEVARPENGSTLGQFILGTNLLGGKTWHDITADVHGLRFDRGGTASERGGAGELELMIDNTSGDYSPTVSAFYGPGTLVRVSLGPAGNLSAVQFTGLTISWPDASAGGTVQRWVQPVALETSSFLSGVNKAALAAAGAGEAIAARVARILSNAGWSFGQTISVSAPWSGWGFQATTLAQPALTDLYLTADSLGVVARSARSGGLLVTERYAAGAVAIELGTARPEAPTLAYVPVVADSIKTSNDDEAVIGSISVARVGGAATTFDNNVAARLRSRFSQRHDLITQDPGAAADLAHYASIVLGAAGQPYRVEQAQVDTADGAAVWELIKILDVGLPINVQLPTDGTPGETDATAVLFASYFVSGYSISVQPVNEDEVKVTATINTAAESAATNWSVYQWA